MMFVITKVPTPLQKNSTHLNRCTTVPTYVARLYVQCSLPVNDAFNTLPLVRVHYNLVCTILTWKHAVCIVHEPNTHCSCYRDLDAGASVAGPALLWEIQASKH
jgi:hypothetical protein